MQLTSIYVFLIIIGILMIEIRSGHLVAVPENALGNSSLLHY